MPRTATSLLTPFLTGLEVTHAGKHILRGLGITLNGIDASDWCHTLTLDQSRDLIDVTLLGATHHDYEPVNEKLACTFEMFQGNPTLENSLQAAYSQGTPIDLLISVPAPTMPTFTSNCRILAYTRLEADIGDAATATLTLAGTGPAAWTNA